MVPRSAGSGRAHAHRFELTHDRLVDKLDDLARRVRASPRPEWRVLVGGCPQAEVTARPGRWIPRLGASFLPFERC
jgi:hypothetical protein